MLLLGSIAPHIFQFVKTTIFRQHDVDYYIDIIDQDPLHGLSAFVLIGEFIAALPHFLFDRIGYSFYLGGAASLTNDKEVGDGFRYLS